MRRDRLQHTRTRRLTRAWSAWGGRGLFVVILTLTLSLHAAASPEDSGAPGETSEEQEAAEESEVAPELTSAPAAELDAEPSTEDAGPSTEDTGPSTEDTGDDLGQPVPPAPDTGVLDIRSEPSGALVAIDGVKVGATPLRTVVTAGSHRLELFQYGYVLHAEDVVVTSEAPEQVEATLQLAVPWEPPRRPIIIVGTMLGSSLALIATGGTLLGIHDSPPRRRCRGYASPELDCPYRYQTEIAGGTLLGVGFAASLVGMGIAMYTNQRNRKYREFHNHPVRVGPTWAGVSVEF